MTKNKPKKLSAIAEKMRELNEMMKRDGQNALKEAFVDFFNAHPEATSIRWTQYTPYFNDGEACTFSRNDLKLTVNPNGFSDDVKDRLSDEDECAVYVLTSIDESLDYNQRYHADCAGRQKLRALTPSEKQLVDDFDELSSACAEIEKVFKTVFGDHVRVEATREGFNITEYDHE